MQCLGAGGVTASWLTAWADWLLPNTQPWPRPHAHHTQHTTHTRLHTSNVQTRHCVFCCWDSLNVFTLLWMTALRHHYEFMCLQGRWCVYGCEGNTRGVVLWRRLVVQLWNIAEGQTCVYLALNTPYLWLVPSSGGAKTSTYYPSRWLLASIMYGVHTTHKGCLFEF